MPACCLFETANRLSHALLCDSQWRSKVADNQFFRSRATEGPYAQEARDVFGNTLTHQDERPLRERQNALWFDQRPATEKLAEYHLLPEGGGYENAHNRRRHARQLPAQSRPMQGMNSAGVFVGRPSTPEKQRAVRAQLVDEQNRLTKQARLP